MSGDRPSLGLIMRDEPRDTSLTLSLARTRGASYGFGGGILLPEVPSVVPTWIWLHAPEEFANLRTEEFGDLFLVVDDEELTVATSVEARFDTGGDTLWTIAASTEEAAFRAFVVEDPFFIPVAIGIGVVALVGIWKRHRDQDQAAADIVRDTVNRAMDEGRSVEIGYGADTTLEALSPPRLRATSNLHVKIGERPNRQ